MSNSLILNIIENNESNWQKIMEEKHIRVSSEKSFKLFKYDINADFSDPVVREARGIIIDFDPKPHVVCWPFNKFGNYGESYADTDSIHWGSGSIYVQEKVDGSLIKVWWDSHINDWHISTNGSITAAGTKNSEGYDFAEMVYEACPELSLALQGASKDCCYMFELVSPHNQIVVKYNETKLYYLGMKNTSGEEPHGKSMQYSFISCGCWIPKEYPLFTLEECINFAKTFKADKNEGFVVVDTYNWLTPSRVKVKSPDYIAAHHLKGNINLTYKKAVELYFNGEKEEYLTYFPEKKDMFDQIELDIDNMNKEIKFKVAQYSIEVKRDNLSRKDFAIKYNKIPYFNYIIAKIFDGYDKEINYKKELLK